MLRQLSIEIAFLVVDASLAALKPLRDLADLDEVRLDRFVVRECSQFRLELLQFFTGATPAISETIWTLVQPLREFKHKKALRLHVVV